MKAQTFMAFLGRIGVTPEPGQRVFWSIAADGVQPKDLDGVDRELARSIFGDADLVPVQARSSVAVVKGAEIGFSYFAALRLLHRAVTADVRGAAPGELRYALAVAPDLRLARGAVRYALGAAEANDDLRRMLDDVAADGFTILREGGRKVRIEALPASVGGRATRGRRYVEVLQDETEFFKDETSGLINDADVYRSVIARCRGTVWLGSTPWTGGLLKKLFDDNFGKPTSALAATCPTLLMRFDPKVRAAVEAEYARDPESAAREFGCEFLARGSSLFFDSAAVDACMEQEVEVA